MSRRKKTADELADQIERESDDADLWEQEPTQIEARPSRTSVLSLRLPTAEFHALLRAARNVNESLSEYVRKAIALRLRNEQSTATVNVTYTATSETGTSPVEILAWRTAAKAPPEIRPDSVVLGPR